MISKEKIKQVLECGFVPSTQACFSARPSWDLRLSNCGPCCPSVWPHRIPTSPQHIWCRSRWRCSEKVRSSEWTSKEQSASPHLLETALHLLFPSPSYISIYKLYNQCDINVYDSVFIWFFYLILWCWCCCCSDARYFDSLDNIITLSWCAHVPTSMNRWLNDLVITGSTLTKSKLSSNAPMSSSVHRSAVKWRMSVLDTFLTVCWLHAWAFRISPFHWWIWTSPQSQNQIERYWEAASSQLQPPTLSKLADIDGQVGGIATWMTFYVLKDGIVESVAEPLLQFFAWIMVRIWQGCIKS